MIITFKNSLLKPLCLTPDQAPTNAQISFFPRGLGTPRRLDWLLLPCSFFLWRKAVKPIKIKLLFLFFLDFVQLYSQP